MRNILCIASKVRCLAVMRLMGQIRITYGANWEEISRDVDTTSFEARPYLLGYSDSLLDDFVSAYLEATLLGMSNMIMKTLVTTSSTTMKVA